MATTTSSGYVIPATMVNGVLVDDTTGRRAFYGPTGEPAGPVPASGVPSGYSTYTQPDGTRVMFRSGSYSYADPTRTAVTPTRATSSQVRVNTPEGYELPAYMGPGGYLIDVETGRRAFYGPTGEPAGPVPAGGPRPGYSVYTMPDGTRVQYQPGVYTFADPNRAPVVPRSVALDDVLGGQEGDPAQRDALASIMGVLRQYGLEDLADWAWDQILEGSSAAEILIGLYDQPRFKEEFPEIGLRQEAGLPALKPAEILSYRNEARATMRAFGLPEGFFDQRTDFTNLLVADVSISELRQRITDGYVRVTQTDPAVRTAFGQYFGASSDAALAAVFLDPERAVPALQRMATQAEIGGEGARFGFDLALSRARQLEEVGVDRGRAAQGFDRIRELAALFRETISERTDLTPEITGVSAIFGLDQGVGREQIERRLRERVAAFGGETTAFINQEGIGGFRTAE